MILLRFYCLEGNGAEKPFEDNCNYRIDSSKPIYVHPCQVFRSQNIDGNVSLYVITDQPKIVQFLGQTSCIYTLRMYTKYYIISITFLSDLASEASVE